MLTIAIIALVCATLFTGAAGYITLVEHPARLGLADVPLLAQWKPSYDKALPIQSGLAIAGGITGIGAWYLSGNLLWVIGSLVLLANWPFTLLAIMPVNNQPAQGDPVRGGRANGSCAAGSVGEASQRQERAGSSVDGDIRIGACCDRIRRGFRTQPSSVRRAGQASEFFNSPKRLPRESQCRSRATGEATGRGVHN